ncbi:helix-turn-helix transcriptional regulator [Fontivita pretiosa]|uniref:helix-turn-helix transcriptional regulator n=1 Tax=Fontivita pretiosa TaxID=2989684 RepID=UPI003D173B6D
MSGRTLRAAGRPAAGFAANGPRGRTSRRTDAGFFRWAREVQAARAAPGPPGTGLTQAQFAAKAGVSREYINYLERGTRSPTVSVFVKLCRGAGLVVGAALKTIDGASSRRLRTRCSSSAEFTCPTRDPPGSRRVGTCCTDADRHTPTEKRITPSA